MSLSTLAPPRVPTPTPTEEDQDGGDLPPTLTAARWMEAAACQYTDPEVFFPAAGEPSLPARRICYRCPVVSQCLQWALSTAEPHGVLGGQSVRERRALATAMRAWAVTVQMPCPQSGPVPTLVQQAYLVANTAVAA